MIAVAVAGCTLPDMKSAKRTNERAVAGENGPTIRTDKDGETVFRQRPRDRHTQATREAGHCFVQASEETRRPKSTSGKNERRLPRRCRRCTRHGTCTGRPGSNRTAAPPSAPPPEPLRLPALLARPPGSRGSTVPAQPRTQGCSSPARRCCSPPSAHRSTRAPQRPHGRPGQTSCTSRCPARVCRSRR